MKTINAGRKTDEYRISGSVYLEKPLHKETAAGKTIVTLCSSPRNVCAIASLVHAQDYPHAAPYRGRLGRGE